MDSALLDPPGDLRSRLGRRAGPAILAVLALLAAWAVWTLAHQESGVRRQVAAISTLIPVEEPPPPPPPKTPPPPEPKPIEQPVPQPTPPTPAPQTPSPQAPSPSPAQPTAGQNAVTENAAPQAGSDAFGLAAGLGSGMRGSGTAGGGGAAGINLAGYSAYLKVEIARLLKAQGALLAVRSTLQIWIETDGRVSRIEGGGPDYDLVHKTLLGHALRSPPAGAPMPVKLSLDVRRD